jgi:poly-gamma-glutamate capsule biosynthesis protein CapA/YwtB (metallophosphatase superfamily)
MQSTNSPFQPGDYTPLPTVTRAYTPTPSPTVKTIWVGPAVPDSLVEFSRTLGYVKVDDPGQADVKLDFALTAGENQSTWIYALVAPFPTIPDGISLDELLSFWRGNDPGLFNNSPLWMDSATLLTFTDIWGTPDPSIIHVATQEQLNNPDLGARPPWAIVPFDALDPRWKVLIVDGQSPIHNDFNPDLYPLKAIFTLDPPVSVIPTSNRDPDKLTVLIMTGVTALVRSTAGRMVTKGLTYPGEDVRDTFRAADLLHISNEVSFSEDCPSPYPLQETLLFCSDPSYIALLEDLGTDIVELSGNHVLDYGPDAMLLTLDMYSDRGWRYFGGGRNSIEATQAITLEHNGNKIAFIGCNPVGPEWAWATNDSPGSAECDYEFMLTEVARLRSEGYLPIVTFQHYEYYALYPSTSQIADFRSMAEAGAVIVSGSHSHFPQYMEFYNTSYIHYGLGNLFFDQMDYPAVGTRREFADRHVFYDGRYISVELLTYMLEDYARPRHMEDWERDQFLHDVFEAAGWDGD